MLSGVPARSFPFLALVLGLSACAEPVMIKSFPTGAKVTVDGQYVGTTPARIAIPRSRVSSPHDWRVEFRNCDYAEGRLMTRVPARRIVAYIFTLGIAAAFKGPNEFVPVDVALQGGDCEGPPIARTAPAAPAGITIQQIVGDHSAASGTGGTNESKTRRLAERLTTLRDLYNRKLISKDVYDQEMQKAARDLSD